MNNSNNTLLKSRREVIGLLGAGTSISIAGCSSSPDTAEETAEEYLSAKYNGEYEKTKSYTTGLEQDRIEEDDFRRLSRAELESIDTVNVVDSDVDELTREALIEYKDLAASRSVDRELELFLVEKGNEWLVVKDTGKKSIHTDATVAHEFDDDIDGSLANTGIEFFKALFTNPEKAKSLADNKSHLLDTIDYFIETFENHELESISLDGINIEENEGGVSVITEHDPTYRSGGYELTVVIEEGKVTRLQ